METRNQIEGFIEKKALKVVRYSWQFQMTIWADEYKTEIKSQKKKV
jgi:hypothetical protein